MNFPKSTPWDFSWFRKRISLGFPRDIFQEFWSLWTRNLSIDSSENLFRIFLKWFLKKFPRGVFEKSCWGFFIRISSIDLSRKFFHRMPLKTASGDYFKSVVKDFLKYHRRTNTEFPQRNFSKLPLRVFFLRNAP